MNKSLIFTFLLIKLVCMMAKLKITNSNSKIQMTQLPPMSFNVFVGIYVISYGTDPLTVLQDNLKLIADLKTSLAPFQATVNDCVPDIELYNYPKGIANYTLVSELKVNSGSDESTKSIIKFLSDSTIYSLKYILLIIEGKLYDENSDYKSMVKYESGNIVQTYVVGTKFTILKCKNNNLNVERLYTGSTLKGELIYTVDKLA